MTATIRTPNEVTDNDITAAVGTPDPARAARAEAAWEERHLGRIADASDLEYARRQFESNLGPTVFGTLRSGAGFSAMRSFTYDVAREKALLEWTRDARVLVRRIDAVLRAQGFTNAWLDLTPDAWLDALVADMEQSLTENMQAEGITA